MIAERAELGPLAALLSIRVAIPYSLADLKLEWVINRDRPL